MLPLNVCNDIRPKNDVLNSIQHGQEHECMSAMTHTWNNTSSLVSFVKTKGHKRSLKFISSFLSVSPQGFSLTQHAAEKYPGL